MPSPRDVQTLRIPPPLRGLYHASSPEDVPYEKGYAWDLANFLVDQGDVLVERGNITGSTAFPAVLTCGSITGIWRAGNQVFYSLASQATNGNMPPYRAAGYRTTAATLRQGDASGAASLISFNPVTGTSASTASASRNNCVGPTYTAIGGFVYGPQGDNAGATFTDSYGVVHVPTSIMHWAGAAALPIPYTLANHPSFVRAIAQHYNRLFVAAARSPAGAGTEFVRNRLYYSDAYGSTAWPVNTMMPDLASAWQDAGSNYQYIDVGTDDSDYLVGFAKAGTNLVLFMGKSIWMLYGNTPSTFVVKQITGEFGCHDVDTICQYENGVIFASDRGIKFFDGSKFSDLSSHVDGSIGVLVQDDSASPTISQRIVNLGRNYVGVFGSSRANATWEEPGKSYLLHVPTKAYICLSTMLPAAYGGGVITFNNAITLPSVVTSAATNQIGLISDDSQFIRSGNITARSNAGARDTDGTASRSIQTYWSPGVIRLGQPGYNSKLHRIIVRYCSPTGANADVDNVYRLRLVQDRSPTAIKKDTNLTNTKFTQFSLGPTSTGLIPVPESRVVDAPVDLSVKSTGLGGGGGVYVALEKIQGDTVVNANRSYLFDLTIEFLNAQASRGARSG